MNKNKIYSACMANNQPEYREKSKIFAYVPEHDNTVLLESGEYIVLHDCTFAFRRVHNRHIDRQLKG